MCNTHRPYFRAASGVWRPQLRQPLVDPRGRDRLLDGVGQEIEDLVVSSELREVLEREVDRAGERRGPAQVTELVELSLATGHADSIRGRADRSLRGG